MPLAGWKPAVPGSPARGGEGWGERGGVLGAMESGYQRGRIQDESMQYEHMKHDGSLPIIGVNTFLNPDGPVEAPSLELARATESEKRSQVERLRVFHDAHSDEAESAMAKLKDVTSSGCTPAASNLARYTGELA